ncbi:MAG: ABC transporter permease [SAR202 cluster bacterium]|nr:ABC transporter permease [SAR202 cluster bacterium]
MKKVLIANIKMTLRDRQTLFWALVFPLIFVTVFGLFDVDSVDPSDIALIDRSNSPQSQSLRSNISSIQLLQVTDAYPTEAAARQAIHDRDLDYALVIPEDIATAGRDGAPSRLTLYFSSGNPGINQLTLSAIQQVLDQANLEIAGAGRSLLLSPQSIQDKDVKYYDQLLLGLIGMAIMFNSIIVIAVKISGYRQQRILRRLLVTPLPLRNYFAAEVITYLGLALIQTSLVLAVGVFVFGGQIHGSLLWIYVIVFFANLVFLNIGFAIGGSVSSPAAASGLANVIAMPMMFFSGTFFPTSTLPAFLPDLVQVLPLTPAIDALHAVGIDGKPLWDTWPQLAMLSGWIIASSILAIKTFRFD